MEITNSVDKNYKTLIQKILDEGYMYKDPNRKNVERLEIPSYVFRHEFKDGFPAISLKKLAWKSVVTELLWFLKGRTNIKYLIDNGCNIWNKDAYNYYLKQAEGQPQEVILTFEEWLNEIKKGEDLLGDLGKVYGRYWRNFNGVDQIGELIHNMINKPMSSELLVVARDPSHKDEQALPCCHYGFQIVMRPLSETYSGHILDIAKDTFGDHNKVWESPKYGFELHWKQRSVDTFLGLPFNIASYALLALILEKITGHKALGIQGDLKKVHLYDNSLEAAKELITRECSEEIVILNIKERYEYERLRNNQCTLNNLLSNIEISDFNLENYNPQGPLKVEMLSRD